jgi:LysM repeat protein
MNAFYYCPHLGKEGDPETAIGFPHSSNRCYAGKSPLAVKNDYQERYCLNPNHQNCSVYQQNPVTLPGGANLPEEMAAPSQPPEPGDALNPPTKPGNPTGSRDVEITQPVNISDDNQGDVSEQTAPQQIVSRQSRDSEKSPPSAIPSTPPPEKKKPTPAPSAIPTAPVSEKKKPPPTPREVPPPPVSEQKKPVSEPSAQPKPPAAEKRQSAPSPQPAEKKPGQSAPPSDLYEPGSIAPPRPADGSGRKTPPRPRKIPGLEAYGPQSYGPQTYGPEAIPAKGTTARGYGPNSDAKGSKGRKGRGKRHTSPEGSGKGKYGTQPVNVRGMAPITSPRKRMNWLTILEVLMGIVVLGGIVLVIWLMISLIPGASRLDYTVPADASTTRQVTQTLEPAPTETAAPLITDTAAFTPSATQATPTPEPTETETPATPTPEETEETTPTPEGTETTPTPEETEEATATPEVTASPNATATAAAAACEYPEGWVPYTVQSGDVLINLAEFFGLTLAELQEGNCMDDETLIYPGDVIYLPEINENTAEATEEP